MTQTTQTTQSAGTVSAAVMPTAQDIAAQMVAASPDVAAQILTALEANTKPITSGQFDVSFFEAIRVVAHQEIAPLLAAIDALAPLLAAVNAPVKVTEAGTPVVPDDVKPTPIDINPPVNTGQSGWIVNGTPAVTVDAASVASCAPVDGAAYISLNPVGQVNDGLYTFSLMFHSDTPGTLKGMTAASNLIKSISLNGVAVSGIPYIDYTQAKPFEAGNLIVGENTVEFVVQGIGAGLMALAVAFTSQP